MDWFKIKTSVRTDYGQFDKINKMHRKIVTYRVIPFKIHVLKFIPRKAKEIANIQKIIFSKDTTTCTRARTQTYRTCVSTTRPHIT